MAKRGPQSELTDRNWDQEEEPEEAGTFKQASKDIIGQRLIKKAKRRGQEDSLAEEGKTVAFGGFQGLMARPSMGQNNNVDKPSMFKISTTGNDSAFKPNFTGGATSPADNSDASSKPDSKDNSSYLHGLKALNESVLAWIKQHVDKNPYIILTPIFKDYEKYLATIEPKKGKANGSSVSEVSAPASNEFTKSVFAAPVVSKQLTDDADSKKEKKDSEESTSTSKAPSSFSFGSSSSNGEGFKPATTGFTFGKTSTASPGFSFGLSNNSSTAAAATTTTTASGGGFVFGGKSVGGATSTAPSTGFTFGSSGSTTTAAPATFGSSGFSFGSLASKAMSQNSAGNSQSQEGGDDDEYVPPKPEVKEITEEGSMYSKRCKLFYQKEGQWTERGVGNVHVKPLEETKTQILVRADTNLGNILLNVMLSSGLPVSRQGKNNVLLVCVPNPPLKEGQTETKPVPMLIRVKTGEEADELLAKLEERKALL